VRVLGQIRSITPEQISTETISSLKTFVASEFGNNIPFAVYCVDGFQVRKEKYFPSDFVLLPNACIVQIATIFLISAKQGAKTVFLGRECLEKERATRPIPDVIYKGDKKILLMLPRDDRLLYRPIQAIDKCIMFHCCVFSSKIAKYDAPRDWPCCTLQDHKVGPDTVMTKQIVCTRRNPYYYLHNLTRAYRLLYLTSKDTIPNYTQFKS